MALSPLPSPTSSSTGAASLTPPAPGSSSTTGSSSGTGSLGEMDFLNLLTTQLKSQDPTKPMDDTQFVAQMAQFSSLQETQQLNQNFQAFNQSMTQTMGLQTLAQASGLIGKEVFAGPDATDRTMGQVSEVRQQNGETQVVVQTPDGKSQSFSLDQIQQVGVTQDEQASYKPPAAPAPGSAASIAQTMPAGYSPLSAIGYSS